MAPHLANGSMHPTFSMMWGQLRRLRSCPGHYRTCVHCGRFWTILLELPPSRFAVLDVQAVPCRSSAALSPRGLPSAAPRPALQKIGCVTLLRGQEDASLFRVYSMEPVSLAEHSEADILGRL